MWVAILFAIEAILVAAMAGVVAALQWRRRVAKRLDEGCVKEETARGVIGYAEAGARERPVALVLHGGLGGWDQGMMLAEDLHLQERFRVIAPSRSGYPGTSLTAGKTTSGAAEAMIALMDARGVEQAFVFGVSGGGPTAVAIATRFPHRVRALVMLCAISHHHKQPGITTDSLFGKMLFSNAGTWLLDTVCWITLGLTRIAPSLVAHHALQMTELGTRREIRMRMRELRKSPARLRWFLRLLECSFPIGPRKVGLENDLMQFASLGEKVDGRIECPTLVIHGRIDGNVPVAHAEAVLRVAKHAEALIIDDASHLVWLHPRVDELSARVAAFLAEHEGHAEAPSHGLG